MTFIRFEPICLDKDESYSKMTLETISTQNLSTTVKKIEVLNHIWNVVRTPGIYNCLQFSIHSNARKLNTKLFGMFSQIGIPQ